MDLFQPLDGLSDDRAFLLIKGGRFHLKGELSLFLFEVFYTLRQFFELAFLVVA